jgi:hypothetical protein
MSYVSTVAVRDDVSIFKTYHRVARSQRQPSQSSDLSSEPWSRTLLISHGPCKIPSDALFQDYRKGTMAWQVGWVVLRFWVGPVV